jgi:hypothetical protein
MIPIYRWGEIQSKRTQSRLNSKKHPMLSLAIFAAERTSDLFAVFDSPTI